MRTSVSIPATRPPCNIGVKPLCCRSVFDHVRLCDPVVQRTLLRIEAGHDEPDIQDDGGQDLRELASRGRPVVDGGQVLIDHPQPHGHLADGLSAPARHQDEVSEVRAKEYQAPDRAEDGHGARAPADEPEGHPEHESHNQGVDEHRHKPDPEAAVRDRPGHRPFGKVSETRRYRARHASGRIRWRLWKRRWWDPPFARRRALLWRRRLYPCRQGLAAVLAEG